MKKDELKLRIVRKLDDLIDTYFSNDNLAERFANSTAKYVVKTKAHSIDKILELFTDENGCIDETELYNHFCTNLIGDGIKVNIKDYVKSDLVSSMLPDKILLINKDDLMDIFENVNRNRY